MFPVHAWELSWMERLHQLLRSGSTDYFFTLLNFLDTQEFAFILIPVIWMCYQWKWGARLFYIVLINAFVNHILKHLFEQPRPFHLNSLLGVIHVGEYGFPSGAAQSAILLSGILVYEWRNKWACIAAANFFFWLSFSRIYLGVHFPTDILGGWLAGSFLLWMFYRVRPKIEEYVEQQSSMQLLGISVLAPLVLFLFYPSLAVTRLTSAAMGTSVGLILSHHYQLLSCPKDWLQRTAFTLIAIVGGAFIYYSFIEFIVFTQDSYVKYLGSFLQYNLMGLWLSFGTHVLGYYLFQANSKEFKASVSKSSNR